MPLQRYVVKGKTSLPLLSAPTEVLATFELVGATETLAHAHCAIHCRRSGGSSTAFPELPFTSDYDGGQFSYDSPEMVLDSFKLKRLLFLLDDIRAHVARR